MARTLADLPSKRQFYNKLNEFVEEAYVNMTVGIPRAGQHTYILPGRTLPVMRYDKMKRLPPNSGRLLGSLPKPGRIHMKGFAEGAAKAGKLTFIVKNEDLYDPVMQEHYWSRIAYNAKTVFDNTNRHRNFWVRAAKQLRGNLMTYRDLYGTYRPAWMGKLTEEQEAESNKEMTILFMSLLSQADEEGVI